jgi:hypothetical protein
VFPMWKFNPWPRPTLFAEATCLIDFIVTPRQFQL